MRILVCIKQVPGTNKVQIDPQTGTLMRSGVESKLNPYDSYALETALRISKELDGEVVCLTMGPPSAEDILKEAYMMGVDEAYLLTDRRFAGADVLATSRTLALGIKKIGRFDLIICGRQTTDGDTAQVGPAIAEHLGIPHVSWVSRIAEADTDGITVCEDMMEFVATVRLPYPCLITVEKGIFQPRLPSYVLWKANADKEIVRFSAADIGGDPSGFGLEGSPTQVERIFPPDSNEEALVMTGTPEELSEVLFSTIREKRLI